MFTVAADTETIPGKAQLKLGRYHHFEVYCDEPEFMGGEFKHPAPWGISRSAWVSDSSLSSRVTRA